MTAKHLRGDLDEEVESNDAIIEGPNTGKRRKLLLSVERTLTQTELKVYKGIAVPFNREQNSLIKHQFL